MVFLFCFGGCTIALKTAWSAISKPVAQILDLNPSQCTAATGTSISSFTSSTTLSISSPIIPVAQELVTKIALGEYLLFTSNMIFRKASVEPNMVSFSFMSVPTYTVSFVTPRFFAITLSR